MDSGKKGFFSEELSPETYRHHEVTQVTAAPEGLHRISDTLFLSVAERSNQMQNLAKKRSRRLLSSENGFFDDRRNMRPKGYLFAVVALSYDADRNYVTAALHAMRRFDIPGAGTHWTLPNAVHFSAKLAEWAGYEEPEDYEADTLSEEDEDALARVREGGWLLAVGQS